jgi:flagellar protein FlgJ
MISALNIAGNIAGNIAKDNAGLLLESSALDKLKLTAKQQSPDALKQVAKQFEALFMGILTKSMRATGGDSLLDNQQTQLYTELLDQQFAQKISAGRGLGLADALVQQLSRNQIKPIEVEASALVPLPIERGQPPKAFSQGLPGNAQTPLPIAPNKPVTIKPLSDSPNSTPPNHPREFVSRLLPHATTAARELGVKPQAILAQAALETGWGKHQIKLADGRPSHNVFGIKAGAAWSGPVAQVSTTEYVRGVAQQRLEKFRAYGSYDEAFRDYAGLLKSAPRYRAVLNTDTTQGFAQGLQKAGYATDPQYAAKISRIAENRAFQALA